MATAATVGRPKGGAVVARGPEPEPSPCGRTTDSGAGALVVREDSTSRFEGMVATRLRPLARGVQGCIRFAVSRRTKPKGSSVLTIKAAAEMLGVSEMTLRRWDQSGKFRARRHPVNGYRLYDRARVVSLRKHIVGSGRGVAA